MNQSEFQQRAETIYNGISKRQNKTPEEINDVDELWVYIQTYKYGTDKILLDTTLTDNDIISILIKMYPKAIALHTDYLDNFFTITSKPVNPNKIKTGDKRHRPNVKHLLPEETPLTNVPITDTEVEAAIIEYLSTNKWRNQSYQQLIDKVAPHYKDKKYKANNGRELSVFWKLLQNTIDSQNIIEYKHKKDNKEYIQYKYCPEKAQLNSKNNLWLGNMCKIINMGLVDINTPLNQSEIYELVQIYCGTMSRDKVYRALKYMVAVGRLKTFSGACFRTYYYIDLDRDIEKEKILKSALLDEYL